MGLEDEFGVWTEDEDQMGRLASTYFDTMFTTSNPTGFDEILNGLVPTVTEEMNNSLRNLTQLKRFSKLSTIWPLS